MFLVTVKLWGDALKFEGVFKEILKGYNGENVSISHAGKGGPPLTHISADFGDITDPLDMAASLLVKDRPEDYAIELRRSGKK